VVLQSLSYRSHPHSDTTGLQPVVLQFPSYPFASTFGHHRASAGGSSISKLPLRIYIWTPPGFSRWYFNFAATDRWFSYPIRDPSGFEESFVATKLKHHAAKAGGVETRPGCAVVTMKLKHHAAKAGGVGGS